MTTPGTLKRHKRASREATKERAPPTVEGQIHSHQRLKQTSSRVKTQEKQARKRKGAGAVRWQRGGELGKAVGSAKLLRVQPWFVLSNSGLLTSRFPSHGGFSHGKMKKIISESRSLAPPSTTCFVSPCGDLELWSRLEQGWQVEGKSWFQVKNPKRFCKIMSLEGSTVPEFQETTELQNKFCQWKTLWGPSQVESRKCVQGFSVSIISDLMATH